MVFQNISTGKSQREANPNLNPEKTWMLDLGTDVVLPKFRTSFNITGYYGEIEDIVSYRYDENPLISGGSIIRSQNLGGAKIYGLEIGFSQPLTEHLSLIGALTLNHSEIIDDPLNSGHQLRNAPDYWGSLQLAYLNPALVNANLLFRFSDDRYYDDENTELPFFHMSSYETVDLKIWRDWKLCDTWTLTTTLSAVNIFDDDYETEIVYVNPGRYIEGMIGVKYLF
ncbi:MAG: TonB-dependent receptor [Desulfobacteraceae bacterium]|nr:TonB-dependent receptor [Desulfobacteraceae bacterium]